MLKIIAVISIIYLFLLYFFGLDWFIADGDSIGNKRNNYLIVFVTYFGLVLVLILYTQSENKDIDLFYENNDKKSLIDSDINKTNGIFSRFNSFLQDAQEVVCNTIPIYKEINELQQVKEKRYVECYKVRKVFNYFNVKKLEDGIADFANNSINECEGSDETTIRKSIIAHVCEKTSCDKTLVNLLVSYYYGESTDVEIYWKITKNNKKLLSQIAHIVWKLNIFNLYQNSDGSDKELNDGLGEELNEDDLKLILSKTQKFEQSLITNNVLLYIQIYKHVLNYREKLAKEKTNEKINLNKQLTKKEIIDNINFSNDFISNFIDVFSKELRESLDIDSKDAYADALMAIILSPDINFREIVCKNASNDEAIYVLMVYYDLREQKGASNEQFSLFEILDEDKTKTIKEKINIGYTSVQSEHTFEIIYKHIRDALYNGEWCESSQTIIQSKVGEILKKLKKYEKNENVINIFAKYFKNININTIETAIDAGLFTIYLILIPKPAQGNFLPIIDMLTVQKHKEISEDGKQITVHYETTKSGESTRSFDPKKIENFKTNYDVSLLLDPHTPKYDFEEYTMATRIGILHKTMPFLTFVDNFNKDVEKVMSGIVKNNPSTAWEKITFIILRISPSKHTFGLMNDKINIDNVKSFGNVNLANKIAELASPYLTDQQKTLVATFENDISFKDIFEKMTIFDILSSNIQHDAKEYSDFLKNEDLNNLIKEHLKAHGIDSFGKLSRRLLHHPDTYSELKDSLSSLICEEYKRKNSSTFNKYILDDLDDVVSDFLNSIKSMNDIWNHDAFVEPRII